MKTFQGSNSGPERDPDVSLPSKLEFGFGASVAPLTLTLTPLLSSLPFRKMQAAGWEGDARRRGWWHSEECGGGRRLESSRPGPGRAPRRPFLLINSGCRGMETLRRLGGPVCDLMGETRSLQS